MLAEAAADPHSFRVQRKHATLETMMHVRTTALALAAGVVTLPLFATSAPAADGAAVQLGPRPYYLVEDMADGS